MRAPWLVVCFVAALAALSIITVVSGPDAAKALDLHLIVFGLAAGVTGAHRPLDTADPPAK